MSVLRIDPEQRFTCSQCGRCCHRFNVAVSEAEVDLYRKRNAAAWFRGTDGNAIEGEGGDPFEPFPGLPAPHRIRQRAGGACGFLSPTNRCRIFPYAFHQAADAVVVTASFGCPTIVANQSSPIGTGQPLIAIGALRDEWFARNSSSAAPLQLVAGRSMSTRSSRVLRDGLLAMLRRESDDIRENIRRIAGTIDDLTRSRVLALSDTEFAEYIALTVPHAVATDAAPAVSRSSWITRLLQYGFLFTVRIFREALMEASDVSHTRSAALDWVMQRFGGDSSAIWFIAQVHD